MNTEDRLREALHEQADGIEPGDDSWMRIRARIDAAPTPARRRHRPVVVAGVALATVLALVLGLAVLRDSDDATRVATTSVPKMPARIAALTSTGDLVVLDSRSGEVERTLVRGVNNVRRGSSRRGSIDISPSRDGRYLYFATNEAFDGSEECSAAIDVVARVAVSGGGEARVGTGRAAAVSPDGRWLATSPLERAGSCDDGEGSAVQLTDLTTGEQRTIPGAAGILFSLSWAPDSRHLGFQWSKGDSFDAYVLDTVTARSSADARCICAQSDDIEWDGYLGSTGEFLGDHAPAAGGSRRARVIALDSEGVESRTLFAFDGVVNAVAADRSGRNVLVVGGQMQNRVLRPGLYRWSRGEAEPTKIADGITSAAWLP